jgi:hypothetical protein
MTARGKSKAEQRAQALERIRANIERHGSHVYRIAAETSPGFSYTIGLRESVGAELVFAGGRFFYADDVKRIIDEVTREVTERKSFDLIMPIDSLGMFRLRKVCAPWSRSLLLGARDYYDVDAVDAYQIVPDKEHWTIDIPDLGKPWTAESEPVWHWYHEPWTLPILPASHAATDMAALRGARITEATRWEDDYWELFARPGPEQTKEEMRIVPLQTLLAVDDSLRAVLKLAVGKGIWRDDVSEWHPMRDPDER